MTTQAFSNISVSGINFSAINASETDTGATLSFLPAATPSTTTASIGGTNYTDLLWGGLNAGVGSPGANQSITLDFTVTDTNTGNGIEGLQLGVAADSLVGPGVGFTGSIQAYNGTTLVGQASINDANPSAPSSYSVAGDVAMTKAYASLNIVVTLDFAELASAPNTAYELYSAIQAGVSEAALSSAPATSTITAIVFNDTNGDGVQDNGETGVAGVTVNLLNNSGAVIATTTTNAQGQYTFTEPSGTYTVQVVPPSGTSISVQAGGAAAGSGGGGPGSTNYVNPSNGSSTTLTLVGGQSGITVDAPLYTPGAIAGTVFNDTADTGILTTGDTGVAGVTVSLYDASGLYAQTTTAANGTYSFTGLAPGSGYYVVVTKPSADNFSPQVAETTTNPATSVVNATTGQSGTITVLGGQTVSNVDAGLYVPPVNGSVTGVAFLDTNGNGVKDSGETGLSGVTVTLLSGATVIATTTTGSGGAYTFANVAPGTNYSVKIATPSGDVVTTQTAETTAAPDASLIGKTTNQTATFTVASGQTVSHVDGGFYQPASLGGIVFNDVNKNSLQNTGETGLSGVTVTLLNGSGVSTGITTTTNASGAYSFTGLAPGSYEVKFTAPSGYTYSAQDIVAGQVDTTANASTGTTSAVTLASGQSNQTLDEGLYKAATGPAITVTKTPNVSEICSGGYVTFTFQVTNTGNQALTDVKLQDNIGTASCPIYLTPNATTTCGGYNVGDSNHNGILDVGETWTYSLTVQENANTVTTGGGWNWVSNGCWGGYWSYSCPTTTQVNTSAVDTVTASASTICSTNNGCGCSSYQGYGFDEGGHCCSFTYAKTDGCGDYWNASGQLVYTDTDSDGSSKAQDFGNQWGYCGGGDNGCGGWGYSYYGCGNNYYNSSANGCSNVSFTTGKGCSYNAYSDSNGCNTNSVNNCSTGNYGNTGCTTTPTTSSCTPTVVTATASANVEVLACNNTQVTTNGCQPSGELNCLYGHAEKIEFTFNPCNTVSHSVLCDGSGSVTGGNGANCAFIEVINSTNPHDTSCNALFEGTVTAGEKFYADATTCLTGAAGCGQFSNSCGTYAYVYNSQAAFLAGYNPTQTICYNTTGSSQLYCGDQVGSLTVCGYVGTSGHGYVCS